MEGAVPQLMGVSVKDPWYLGEKLWLHRMLVDGRETAGLVTGTPLPEVDVHANGRVMRVCEGSLVDPGEFEGNRILHRQHACGIRND